MTREITIKIHCIADDGLPPADMDPKKVAFPVNGKLNTRVDANDYDLEDLVTGQFGFTHWLEFPVPVSDLTK